MWFNDSVVYQIYPIGFCGAPRSNDGFEVSRIRKVIDWCDYLKELGVTAVLFNPVFESDNHGYDTRDFTKIDVRLGTNQDFKDVCDALHARGIKVILDGVFNHVGRGFPKFRDVQEKKWDSPYKDWFFTNFDGNSCYNDGFWYEGWEGHYELVKLNLRNYEVRDYLCECIKGWVNEFGIDGLRLDVAYSLDRDFMKHLRWFVTQLKSDFALIGEVLFGDYNQIVNDEMLHSCTNYECYKGLYSSLNSMNLFEIAHSLNRQFGPEQCCIYRGKHLMTFADNHDVTRLASILTNPNHVKLAYGILMAMPGVPCIYYGSEWGAVGKKENGDDDLRPSFQTPVTNDLSEYIKKLIELRKNSDALCNGGYENLIIQNHQLIFKRATDKETVIFMVNAADYPYTAYHSALNGEFTDLLTGESVAPGGQYTIPPLGIAVLGTLPIGRRVSL